MKTILIGIPLLLVFAGCLTTSEVYLPHTSRVFHKKNCVGLKDPSPIVYPSAQVALSTGGVEACSVCIKDRDYKVSNQGYTNINYAQPGMTTGNTSQALPPASSTAHKIAKTTLQAISEGSKAMSESRARSQASWHQFNVESQMRQQTNIQRQQLYNQQDQQRYLRQQQLLNEPSLYNKYGSTPIAPETFNYKTNLPPTKNYQYTPIESPFKGSGILGN